MPTALCNILYPVSADLRAFNRDKGVGRLNPKFGLNPRFGCVVKSLDPEFGCVVKCTGLIPIAFGLLFWEPVIELAGSTPNSCPLNPNPPSPIPLPTPQTRNHEPETRNPKPETRNSKA